MANTESDEDEGEPLASEVAEWIRGARLVAGRIGNEDVVLDPPKIIT